MQIRKYIRVRTLELYVHSQELNPAVAGSPSTICVEQFLLQKRTEFLAAQGGQGKSGALAALKVGTRALIGQRDAGLKLREAYLRREAELLRWWEVRGGVQRGSIAEAEPHHQFS